MKDSTNQRLEGESRILVGVSDMRNDRELLHHPSVLAALSDPLIVMDTDWVICGWNQPAEEVYGWCAEEAIGRPTLEIMRPIYGPGDREAIIAAYLERGFWRGEVVHRHKDGSRIEIQATVSAVRDAEGTITGAVALNRDITARVRAEAELVAVNRLLAAAHEVGQLIPRVSDRAQLLKRACAALAHHGAFAAVWFCRPEGDEGVFSVHSSGLEGGDERLVRTVGETLPCYQALLASGARMSDWHLSTSCAGCALAGDHPAGGSACFRSAYGETLYGALCVAREADDPPVEQELTLLYRIAEDLALALHAMEGRQRADDAIRDRAQLLDLTHDLICVAGTDGYFKLVNPAWEELLGFTEQELLARPFLDFIHPDDHGRNDEEVASLAAGAPTMDFENRYITKRGETRIISWTASPLPTEGLLFCIGRDVTERRQLQARLVQSERLAGVGLLAAGVAHEINNPLTYSLFNLEGLAQNVAAMRRGSPAAPALLDELAQQVDDALDGANRVREIVRDLKTFSRADEDHLEPISLDAVVEGAINMAQNEIKYRARLIRQLGAPPPVLGNDGKLAQVVLNLLINAAQAIDEGDVADNTIRVCTRQESGEAVIEVEDTGAGISGAALKRLFDPFYTSREGGTGLGLSICRDIVAAHGGSIEARSELGRGSRFVVSLPLAPRADASGAPLDEAPAAPAPGRRGRVLVVDDEPHIGRAIKRMLAEDHDVVLASSGAAAQAVLEQDPRFDVIISDLMMPDVTGMDLYDWVSEQAPELAERIVFVTGGAFTPAAVTFLGRVTNKRLEKPFDPQALKDCLRDLIQEL